MMMIHLSWTTRPRRYRNGVFLYRRQRQPEPKYHPLCSLSSPPSSSSVLLFMIMMIYLINDYHHLHLGQAFTIVPHSAHYVAVRRHQQQQQSQMQQRNDVSPSLHHRMSYHARHHNKRISSSFNGRSSTNVHRLSTVPSMVNSKLNNNMNSETTTTTKSNDNTVTVNRDKKYRHILAILVMPYTSFDRIINESILDTVLSHISINGKISVVLRCGDIRPSIVELRRYVGEIYSQLWDVCIATADDAFHLPNVIVYPQNLPNTAPEAWIDIQKDLDGICSYNTIIGWTSSTKNNNRDRYRIQRYADRQGDGQGGLKEHVDAVNRERYIRQLSPVDTILVDTPKNPILSTDPTNIQHVVFIDDDVDSTCPVNGIDDDQAMIDRDNDKQSSLSFLSGPYQDNNKLYNSVVVGGTFDGLHFGHRKLLTLAISSVQPVTGRLLIGITIDAILQHKQYANYIPNYQIRCQGVVNFIHSLAPGFMNQITIFPISDQFGPCADMTYDTKWKFDALVLSHETLMTGYQLNQYRIANGMKPLALLCTRRTEAHGMSSTTLRKLRKAQEQ